MNHTRDDAMHLRILKLDDYQAALGNSIYSSTVTPADSNSIIESSDGEQDNAVMAEGHADADGKRGQKVRWEYKMRTKRRQTYTSRRKGPCWHIFKVQWLQGRHNTLAWRPRARFKRQIGNFERKEFKGAYHHKSRRGTF